MQYVARKLATTPPKNISTAQCNFDELIMALKESMYLEHEIEKAITSLNIYYGQSSLDHKEVRKHDYYELDSKNHEDDGHQ